MNSVSPWKKESSSNLSWSITLGNFTYYVSRQSLTYGMFESVNVINKYTINYTTKGTAKKIRLAQKESIKDAKKSIVEHWKKATHKKYKRIYTCT